MFGWLAVFRFAGTASGATSLVACGVVLLSTFGVAARKPPPGMTNHGLDSVIRRLAPDAKWQKPNVWLFTLEGAELMVITDERADRMRVMAPVADADRVPHEVATRMLQANFDSALDARYALARGQIWSVFIHPLAALDDKELLSGVAQVVNLVKTFGSTYSSGALVFGGGDSERLNRQLYEKILRKGGIEL